MRKLLTILMLCCIFFEVAGYFFAYKIHRKIIKHEVKQYLRTHANEFELEQFSFILIDGKLVDRDFEWKDDHEFSYKGEMYDIIERSVKGEMLNIRCVKDEKENQLIKDFKNLIAGKASSDSSRNSSNNILQLLVSQFLHEKNTQLSIKIRQTQTFNSRNRFDLQTTHSDILTPPPRIA